MVEYGGLNTDVNGDLLGRVKYDGKNVYVMGILAAHA